MKRHLALAAAISAYALTCQASSVEVPQLTGTVSASSDYTQTGLWNLPTAQGGAWDLQFPIDPGISVIYSGVALDGVYYVTSANAQYGTVIYLDAYSIETGAPLWTNYMFSAEYLPYDLAYNPKDNHIYGLFSNKTSNGMRLATVSYADNATLINEIAPLEGDWVALACDAAGQLYGIRSDVDRSGGMPVVNSSSLYKLDRLTGEATLIGETGQKPLVSGSATIDTRSGRMFWTVCPDGIDSYLTEVDLSTGAATRLFGFDASRVVVGMYAPAPDAEDEAPAAVRDASVVFPDGGLDGTVTFTAPTTRFDGTPSSGQVDYSISIDGNEVASGTTYYGATENVPVSVSERGAYTLIVRLVNDAGLSPKVEVSAFAGFGTPLAPANVVAAKADGKITVSWDAVTATADGGFIDPSKISYTVTRRPDGEVVAANVSGTQVIVNADDNAPMAAYSYEVVAVNNGFLSDAAVSGNVVVGTPSLPWTEGFTSASSADFFTIIDANADGKTWSFNNNCMRAQYNSSKPMDDWMITPGIRMLAGNTYRVTFKARSANPSYAERVEARWGSAATAEAMTASLVEPAELPGEYTTLSGYVTPQTDGLYFVGIHGISDSDRYYLEVGEITVEAGMSTKVPAKASDITLTADPSGDYSVAGSLKAPALTIGGDPLQSVDKVDVYRGTALVKSFSSPAPGAELTFTDTPEEGGVLTYDVVAANSFGAGPAASAEVFVGVPVVKAPASASMSEPEVGVVKISWEAVNSTADGREIDPSRVKYNIYDVTGYSPVLVAGPVSGTSCTLGDVTSDGAQRFVQYGVASVTDGGESEQVTTAKLPVGPAYAAFAESFPDGKASTVNLFERVNYGNWAVMADNYEMTSQDGDGGFAVMNAYFAGYSGAYYTGKIDLSGLENPALRFYSYTPDDEQLDLNTIAVGVHSSDDESGTFQEVFRKTVVEMGPAQGWHEVVVSLGNYVGKTVSLRIYAETYDRPYTSTYIDNLSVINLEGVDLEISYINAPVHVLSGDEFTLNVGLANNSAHAASGHVIDLFADDELVLSHDCETIDAMQSDKIELSAVMHPLSSGPVKYHAVVRHPADSRDDNNVSDPVSVNAVASAVPAPTALSATRSGDDVTLTWSAPELSTIPAAAVTDDFESSTAWAHSAPGWVFVDVDNAPVAAFGQAEVPGITAGVTHASFFTFSTTGIFEGNRPLAAHSGTQYLAAFCRFDGGLTDDWAISPELSGEAQTISFWAQSYDSSGDFLESIMVLYSTGSIDTGDFLPTGFTKNPLPNGWARYEVSLPEGARRFAIRSCSFDSFMLMVDDVTFQPVSAHNLTPLGFNVYRDNVKVNDAPLAAPSFTDRVDDPAAHTWVVTSLYEEAESRPSNEAKVGQQGIDAVGASGVSVTALAGRIIVTGAEGELISVSAPDGKLLHNALGESLTEIKALPGVYVVKAGSLTVKVLVR